MGIVLATLTGQVAGLSLKSHIRRTTVAKWVLSVLSPRCSYWPKVCVDEAKLTDSPHLRRLPWLFCLQWSARCYLSCLHFWRLRAAKTQCTHPECCLCLE